MSVSSSFISLRVPLNSFRGISASLCLTWALSKTGSQPWSKDWQVQSFVGPLRTTILQSRVPGEIVFVVIPQVPHLAIWLWDFLTWSFWSRRVGLRALPDFMIKYWARQRQPSPANKGL